MPALLAQQARGNSPILQRRQRSDGHDNAPNLVSRHAQVAETKTFHSHAGVTTKAADGSTGYGSSNAHVRQLGQSRILQGQRRRQLVVRQSELPASAHQSQGTHSPHRAGVLQASVSQRYTNPAAVEHARTSQMQRRLKQAVRMVGVPQIGVHVNDGRRSRERVGAQVECPAATPKDKVG